MDQKVTFTEGKILKSLILFAMPVLFALFCRQCMERSIC